MPPKAKAKRSKTAENEYGIESRLLTIEQRRELFLKRKAEQFKNDFRVVQPGTNETLVPSGNLVWDWVLRLYGLARKGSVYQLHGEEGSGKSTLGYCLSRDYQRTTQEPIAIMDFEGTTTSGYLRALGLDEEMALVKQPFSIEAALKDAMDLLSDGVRFFMWDSIPRMKNIIDPSEIANGNAFKTQPGDHARAIKQFYDIFLPHITRVDGTLLMINQLRSRLDMSREAQQAVKYATVTNLNYSLPGGRSNRYNIGAMIEMQIRKAYRPGVAEDEFLLEAEAQHGEAYLANEVRLRTLKNKITGTGYREGYIWIRPGRGIDENISIRQYGRELKLIANHGKRWFVGDSIESAIKVYDNKAEAITDLVIHPNESVLQRLKGLIVTKMQDDPSVLGNIEVSDDVVQHLAGLGDDDDLANVPSSMKPALDDEL